MGRASPAPFTGLAERQWRLLRLHLVYRFKPTPRARADLTAFWQWVRERQTWFYAGLETVCQTRWYVVTIGPDVHAIEHWVSFADETAWGAYRRKVAEQSGEPEWERRRTSQDEWWEMLDARMLSDAPGPILNAGPPWPAREGA